MHDFAYLSDNSFLRAPRQRAEPGATPLTVAGRAWDSATTNRPGARFGPRAIRPASHLLCDGIHPHFGCSPANHRSTSAWEIDGLDPAFAPGTGTPEAAGLNTAQVMTILEELADLDFVGMDGVEVSPPYDHAEITACAAASLVWTCLAGRIHQRQRATAAQTA